MGDDDEVETAGRAGFWFLDAIAKLLKLPVFPTLYSIRISTFLMICTASDSSVIPSNTTIVNMP